MTLYSCPLPLMPTSQSDLSFKRSGIDITISTPLPSSVIIIIIVRTAPIVGTREVDRPLLGNVELKDGIDNQERSIAVITHHIQVVQVSGTVLELQKYLLQYYMLSSSSTVIRRLSNRLSVRMHSEKGT